MESVIKHARIQRRRLRLVAPLIIVFAAGCASTPPVPATSLQAAQQAIATAERVEAATHAAAELGEARGRLASAQRAVDQEDMLAAERFADEARAGAELAAARSTAAKANAVNQDMKRNTDVLIEEMQRNSGETK